MKAGTPESKAEAQRQLESALARIQAAQSEIGRAQAYVSNLNWVAPEYARLGKLYERIKAKWYRLAEKRHSTRVDLDGIALDAINRSEGAKQ
jgi:hypothetical protein